MFKITDENYTEYKRILEILWLYNARRDNLDPNSEYSPINVLNSWEKKSKSLAKKGLKIGLTDSLTMSMDLSIETKNEISESLITQGLPNYFQLVSIVKGTVRKVLKRGKIKTLEEYYVLKEIRESSPGDMADNDEEQICKLLTDFEGSV